MALTSVFYDGVVTETDRAKNRAGVPDYGVYGIEDFKVTAHPSIANAVLVKAGRAHGFGVTDTAGTDQVVNCATISSGTRWDLIVVRRNWQPAAGGPSTLEAVQGGASAEIPAGRIVGPGVEDDQPLALVRWKAGLSAPDQIIDLRVWAANGGLFAKDALVRSYLAGIGAEVNIDGVIWRYVLGDNDVPGWVAGTFDTVAYSFVDNQPNYDFQGAANVTPLRDGRKRVDVDMTMVRKNINNPVSNARQSMGVVLPGAATGVSNSKVLACPLKVGTGLVFVQIQPSTGLLTFWSQSALTWAEEDFVSVNFTYYV